MIRSSFSRSLDFVGLGSIFAFLTGAGEAAAFALGLGVALGLGAALGLASLGLTSFLGFAFGFSLEALDFDAAFSGAF